jgi:hypothetical protein
MDNESLLELMGRVGALEAALNAVLASVCVDSVVRDDVCASLERMAAVLELGQEPADKAFASGWRLAMRSLSC